MSDNSSLECRVAALVHSHFDALPNRSKPTVQPNGSREWIPLSGIVLVTGENTPHEALTCIAVATGAKCLSSSQIPQCQGLVLHDSHAEVLVLRAFNHWLLEECKSALMHCKEHHNADCTQKEIKCPQAADVLDTCSGSKFLRWRAAKEGYNLEARVLGSDDDGSALQGTWPPFELKEDVKIWMYCTCAPCGDASMELCMAAQEDATPWDLPTAGKEDNGVSDAARNLLNGRAHFSILGAVRRKPSRADAEPTLSKSCSDKLAAKQVSSILSFPTSLLVAPTSNAYITDLLLPEDEYNQVGCERSFGDGDTGRLRTFKDRVWKNNSPGQSEKYTFHPFRVRSLPTRQLALLWEYGKSNSQMSTVTGKSKSGNISAVWTAPPSISATPPYSLERGLLLHSADLADSTFLTKFPKQVPTHLHETLINGVKQGFRISSPGFKKASALSRAKTWDLLRDVVQLLSHEGDDDDDNIFVTPQRGHASQYGYDIALLPSLEECVRAPPTYACLKSKLITMGFLQARSQVLTDVRSLLGNWVENRGDETWGLQVLHPAPIKSREDWKRSAKQGV